MDINDYHPRHICSTCGCRAEEHKGDGTCPPTVVWGHPKKFPTFRSLLHARGADAEARAGKILDKKLARYWSGKNKFRPV